MSEINTSHVTNEIAEKFFTTAVYLAHSGCDDASTETVLSIYGWLLYAHLSEKQRQH